MADYTLEELERITLEANGNPAWAIRVALREARKAADVQKPRAKGKRAPRATEAV